MGELQQRGKSWLSVLSVPFRFRERKCPRKAGAATRKELCNLLHSPSSALHTCWENTHKAAAATLVTPRVSLLLFPSHPISFHHSTVPGFCSRSWETADLLRSVLAHKPCWSHLSQASPLPMGFYVITASLACQFSLQPSDLPSSFTFFIFWITLFSWLCCLSAWSALSLSALVIPSINHSTTTFTAINLLPVFQIKTHFSLPYVNTSNKHRLNVFHF